MSPTVKRQWQGRPNTVSPAQLTPGVRNAWKTAVMASGGTGLMHESYWFEDSSVYTRFWFAMANSYMGMVLLDLAETRPHLLFTDGSP